MTAFFDRHARRHALGKRPPHSVPEPTAAGRRLGIAFLFWTAVGLVFALPRLANHEVGSPLSSTLLLLLSSFVQWWSWGLLAPLIVAVDRQLPFTRGQSGWRVLTHVPLGLATSIASVGLAAVLRALLQLSTWSRVIDPHLFSGALEGTDWSLLVYALIVGAAWAHEYRGRYAAAELTLERVERNYAEVRLTTLRMQLVS